MLKKISIFGLILVMAIFEVGAANFYKDLSERQREFLLKYGKMHKFSDYNYLCSLKQNQVEFLISYPKLHKDDFYISSKEFDGKFVKRNENNPMYGRIVGNYQIKGIAPTLPLPLVAYKLGENGKRHKLTCRQFTLSEKDLKGEAHLDHFGIGINSTNRSLNVKDDLNEQGSQGIEQRNNGQSESR